MTSDEWARVQEVFDAALACEPSAREAFLDAACAGHAARRKEVASLLAAHETAGAFIEAPAYEVAADLILNDELAPLADRVLGPYIVRHEIGRGGMGIVYLADDTRLGRRVALKAIAHGLGQDGRRRDRMRQEARAAAALSHPGIATVYALEEIDTELYLACEYVPGPTLRTLVERGPLPVADVIDIATQLARALAAAHAQGVVHRDLKPENIVRTAAGVIKVLDFGIARIDNAAGARLTVEGASVGTPEYMSPEQRRRDEVDFRTDIFAFGLVVREVARGECPGLDSIVATCLRERPEDRYASTGDLVRDLERLRRGAGPMALSPRWSWECHKIAASAVYALMLYPAWHARPWIPKPWGIVFFFALLAAAAVAVTVRLHLLFTARSYPEELSFQRHHASPWTRCSDAAFSAALVLGALAIATDHGEVAALLLSVAIAAAVASWLIEPVTTRAAFPKGRI